MTSTGSRRASWLTPVVVALLFAVLCGRYLAAPASQPVASPPLNGTPALSASDHGFFAVVSRVPAAVSEAKLDLGAGAPVATGALVALLCTAALALGRGITVLDLLGASCRRRGPPARLAV